MPILDFFPAGLTPREPQRYILERVEQEWDNYNVICIEGPPGVGKTEIELTIASWRESLEETVGVNFPTNDILMQTLLRHPGYQSLHKISHYESRDAFRQAREEARKALVRLTNFYTSWANKLYSKTMIFDECHKLVEMLCDKKEVKIWQRQYHFPDTLKTVGDVVEWLEETLQMVDDNKLRRALQEILKIRNGATLERRRDSYRGIDDVVLHIIPSTTRELPPYLWPPNRVKRLVLLSATISRQDIIELGLDDRHVLYLSCEAPEITGKRIIRYEPAYRVGHRYLESSLPAIVGKIKQMLARHRSKGLIHLPYSLARRMRDELQDPRLMFHGRHNKIEVLQEFKESPEADMRVLIASGLYEGIDLPYEVCRWQLLGKIPYLSLGSGYVAQKSEENPEWYRWEAIKRVVQASGRVRHGVTYICDENFKRLYREDLLSSNQMFPKYFRQSITADSLRLLRR